MKTLVRVVLRLSQSKACDGSSRRAASRWPAMRVADIVSTWRPSSLILLFSAQPMTAISAARKITPLISARFHSHR